MIQSRSIIILVGCIMSVSAASWEIDTNKSSQDPLIIDPGDWEINTYKSSPNPLIIEPGEGFEIQCTVKSDVWPFAENKWKFCNWTRDNDNATCLFTYLYDEGTNKFKIDSKCQGSMNNAVFFGSEDIQNWNLVCGMKFTEADDDDVARWKCEMAQCDSNCQSESGSGKMAHRSINVKVVTFDA